MERLIEDSNRRRQSKKINSPKRENKEDAFTPQFAQRKQELLERNKNNEPYNYHDALDRISNNARKRLQEIKLEHELTLATAALEH